MLDLLNLTYNVNDISYFIIHYAMVPFLTYSYPLVYKNLYKTACDSPNSKSSILYEKYKKEGVIKTDLYKKGLITGDELVEWIESMRVNK